MNVTDYIASGILESYAIGSVSDQERREVDCLSTIYPEIRQELDLLSTAIEEYAVLHSVAPPIPVRTKLLEQLDFSQPGEVSPFQLNKNDSDTSETVVRPMPGTYPSVPTYRATWIVAASVGLLLLIFSFYLLSQLRTTQETLAGLRAGNTTLQAEAKQLRYQQVQTDQALALLRQPNTRTLILHGNEKAPKGDMLVFWNAQTRQVAIEVRSLPTLPDDKQYQLWSLVDGKPVDAGVFDASNVKAVIQQLNHPIDRADAFAVTVEKRGGSPTPTLSTLLAMTPVKA